MKDPYQSDSGGLPTPLTGIETPRVDIDDRGAQRHKPVYMGGSRNPFQYKDEAKQMPSPKREPQPVEEAEKPPLSKPSVSKDTSSSSSSSDSDSNEELDDAKPSEFDIRTLFNGAKPTPSPRQPTSSPPTSYLASPVKTELSGLGLPKLMDPIISPVRDQPSPHHRDKSDPEKEFRQKKNRKDSGKVKPSKTHRTSKASSDDEDVNDKKRHSRSPKKKPVKSLSTEKSGSKKKDWSFMDDTDSEPERDGRSFSSSPVVKTPKKPSSSSQSTPAGQKTSRSSKSGSNSSHVSSKNQAKHRKSEPSRVRALSDSEEEEPPAPSATKSKIFSKMFGGLNKSSGGGKGKGKGGGGKGGGITVTSKEESEDIDDDRGIISRSSPTQVKKEPVPTLSVSRGGSGLKEDLSLSEDSMSSPSLSRQSSLSLRTGGRPSLLTSISLSRLGRSLDKIQSKMKQKKKAGVKQECWITGGVKESQERTPSESEGESRKRREREESAQYDLETSFSKRLRQDPGGLYGTETPPQSQDWPGAGGNLMMPPPFPPKRVYYSYFERRQQDEAFDDDEENVVELAKRLKHEADQEQNMNTKCRKYLQVRYSDI